MQGTAFSGWVRSTPACTALILQLSMSLVIPSAALGQSTTKKRLAAKATKAGLFKQGSQMYGKFCVVWHGANGIGMTVPACAEST